MTGSSGPSDPGGLPAAAPNTLGPSTALGPGVNADHRIGASADHRANASDDHPRPAQTPRRLVIAVTGATGGVHAIRLLTWLRAQGGFETHLVVSGAGWLSLSEEQDLSRAAFEALADVVHPVRDVGASIASGSFQHDGMIVAPCSMRSLAAIAIGLSDNLITRAADVCLKERRRLILMVRETPLNLAHLRNMTAVTEMGGIIFPPLPAFYQHPATVSDIIDHSCSRALDLLGIPNALAPRWTGRRSPAGSGAARPPLPEELGILRT